MFYFSQSAPLAEIKHLYDASEMLIFDFALLIFIIIIMMSLGSKLDSGAHPKHHEVNVLGLLTNMTYNKELLNPTRQRAVCCVQGLHGN